MKKTKLRNYYNSYETYHFQGPKTEFYKKEKMRNVIYVSNKKNQKKMKKNKICKVTKLTAKSTYY